jgi:hypothetical protein
MTETFNACTLPWCIWPWGLTLTHSDTDTNPECSVEFGGGFQPKQELWVKVDFHSAAFASAKPHRDDEALAQVTGYDIVPRRRQGNLDIWQVEEEEWLRTGRCPDPGFYFSTDSKWRDAEQQAWAARQRGRLRPDEAVHFLLDGRDGYVEVLAAGFTWRAWHEGHPRLNEVSGQPVASGEWTDAPV